MARRPRAPATVAETVDAIRSDPRIGWLPIRHHSPACAHHVARWIREHRPVAVLLEAPEEARDAIPWLLHPDATPPLALLSSVVDTRNELGGNGVITPSVDVPARYRGWWPLLAAGPEWAALCAGGEVGAEIVFIDAPLRAVLAVTGPRPVAVASDRALAENAWFRELARRSGRTDFDGFWDTTFEGGADASDPDRFFRTLLTFAWCARHIGGPDDALERDGTLLREGHMRWHVDAALKAHPEGRIAVVTGAFHSVALPFCKPKRARAAGRDARTLVHAWSHRAVARLGALPYPRWPDEVHRQRRAGAAHPCDAAALTLATEIAAALRSAGHAVGTSDAVAAVDVAQGLAALRGGGSVVLEDLLDGVRSAFVKEESAEVVMAIARAVLVGDGVGRLPDEAGRPPLIEDFHAEARHHRIDLTGAAKEVRLEIYKREGHRAKSAFLHRCALLELPMFGEIDGYRGAVPHLRGPDPVTGTDLHLTTETWGIESSEEVDDRLLELSDRGVTVVEVAASLLGEQRARAANDLPAKAEVLLRAAQVHLVELLPALLRELDDALLVDPVFAHRVEALERLQTLLEYGDALPTISPSAAPDSAGAPTLAGTVERAWLASCLSISTLRDTAEGEAFATVDRLQSLARFARTTVSAGVEVRVLVERLRGLVDVRDAQPLVRGAALGLLASFGDASDATLARELRGAFGGSVDEVRRGASMLEGLLIASRSSVLRGRRLLPVIHDVLGRLSDDVFLAVLPDLRRAFAVFVPAEIERLAGRVAEALDPDGDPAAGGPIPAAQAALVARIDARVAQDLAIWLPATLHPATDVETPSETPEEISE